MFNAFVDGLERIMVVVMVITNGVGNGIGDGVEAIDSVFDWCCR
jgi:hypothetical protein